MSARSGLHEEAQRAFESRNPDGLRIALDAVICALAIGQMCVEGVRRIATPTGATLLRAERVPTASGVRKVLGRLIAQTDGGAELDARIAERLIRTATSECGPAIFYVDNHMRPYTGKHVVRKGWRMQDKRVLPGATDYYVHDEDGRPMFRMAVPSHDHLTKWLLPLGKRLRDALGDDEQILLAFDRCGAYGEQLAELRDADFDFVTYERKPYAELPATPVHGNDDPRRGRGPAREPAAQSRRRPRSRPVASSCAFRTRRAVGSSARSLSSVPPRATRAASSLAWRPTLRGVR